MANEPLHPLTTDEAKARLREAARRASPVGFIHRFPWQVVSAALIGGVVVGRSHPQSGSSRRWAAQLLVPMAIGGLMKLLKKEIGSE
jgi:hypothetical protein